VGQRFTFLLPTNVLCLFGGSYSQQNLCDFCIALCLLSIRFLLFCLDIPDLLVDFRVFFYGRRPGIRPRARSQVRPNFVLPGIEIERNSNIAACAKARFEGSLCGDVCVELRLECDKVSRSNGLALLQSTASIAFQLCSPCFSCGRILSRPSASFLLRHIVLLLNGMRGLYLGSCQE
jgi:hypothetical protein